MAQNIFPAPVLERCDNCRAICLCHGECTCMAETVLPTRDCKCKDLDPWGPDAECSHLLCHECTDLLMSEGIAWDGADWS